MWWMLSSSIVTAAWAPAGRRPTEQPWAAAPAAYPRSPQAWLALMAQLSDGSAVTICSCKQRSLHWKRRDPQLQALLMTQGSSECRGGPSEVLPRHVLGLMANMGWVPGGQDVTVV